MWVLSKLQIAQIRIILNVKTFNNLGFGLTLEFYLKFF